MCDKPYSSGQEPACDEAAYTPPINPANLVLAKL